MYNKKIGSFLLILFVSILIVFSTAQICFAGDDSGTSQDGNTSAVSLTNPLTGTKQSESIPVFLGKIISYAMGIIGSLALVMFIYGGITWMLSAGNQQQVDKGKNIIIWAALGIVLIFTAYALVKFVITAVGGATSNVVPTEGPPTDQGL